MKQHENYSAVYKRGSEAAKAGVLIEHNSETDQLKKEAWADGHLMFPQLTDEQIRKNRPNIFQRNWYFILGALVGTIVGQLLLHYFF